MSHYNNLKRNALIALLHERGLNAGKRINKAGLIALLEQHDINTVEVPVESEIENDCLVDETDDVSVDSENIRTLQLQVKLEELKLQQLQLKSHNEGVAPFEATGMTQNTNFVSLPTVRSNLPCMQDDCDVLVYFTTLERAFELNSVPKAIIGPKCCQVCLTQKRPKYLCSCRGKCVVIMTKPNPIFWKLSKPVQTFTVTDLKRRSVLDRNLISYF